MIYKDRYVRVSARGLFLKMALSLGFSCSTQFMSPDLGKSGLPRENVPDLANFISDLAILETSHEYFRVAQLVRNSRALVFVFLA